MGGLDCWVRLILVDDDLQTDLGLGKLGGDFQGYGLTSSRRTAGLKFRILMVPVSGSTGQF